MRRLDYHHRLERIHLAALDEVAKGLTDIKAGRTISLAEARAKYASPRKKRSVK